MQHSSYCHTCGKEHEPPNRQRDCYLQINKVCFSVTGLGNLSGSLTIIAAFQPVSPKRVSIHFESAKLVSASQEQMYETFAYCTAYDTADPFSTAYMQVLHALQLQANMVGLHPVFLGCRLQQLLPLPTSRHLQMSA